MLRDTRLAVLFLLMVRFSWPLEGCLFVLSSLWFPNVAQADSFVKLGASAFCVLPAAVRTGGGLAAFKAHGSMMAGYALAREPLASARRGIICRLKRPTPRSSAVASVRLGSSAQQPSASRNRFALLAEDDPLMWFGQTGGGGVRVSGADLGCQSTAVGARHDGRAAVARVAAAGAFRRLVRVPSGLARAPVGLARALGRRSNILRRGGKRRPLAASPGHRGGRRGVAGLPRQRRVSAASASATVVIDSSSDATAATAATAAPRAAAANASGGNKPDDVASALRRLMDVAGAGRRPPLPAAVAGLRPLPANQIVAGLFPASAPPPPLAGDGDEVRDDARDDARQRKGEEGQRVVLVGDGVAFDPLAASRAPRSLASQRAQAWRNLRVA